MTRKFGLVAGILTSVVLAGLLGCKPSDAIKQSAVLGKGMKPASEPLDPGTLGTISGTVRFAGKPPDRVKIDMSLDPGCKLADNYSEQYVVHEGKLANVYLYVKSGPAVAMTAPPTTTVPVVMDQSGCKYVPHVIALMRGGTVEFRNSDATMHNIHTMPMNPENLMNVSQAPKGAAQVLQFRLAETMMSLRCDLHPWMNSFINVSDTPFFAVTDGEGNFKIEGLPAGTYVLAAVHEKMGEQSMTVTVKPHDTSKAEFSYGPI